MEPTTTGRFRVLDRRPDGTILLVDLADAIAAATGEDPDADLRPIAVTPPAVDDPETDAHDIDAETVDTIRSLEPGYVVEAELAWDDSDAAFLDCEITNRTRIQYADGVTGLFEKAQETWHDAQVAGEAMNSAVTYSTGKEPNGVVYVFAKQDPPRDLFEEFRTGATPIEPLIQRVNATHDGGAADTTADDDAVDNASDDEAERAVFVLNPADEPFVVVYIVFRKDGMLAQTVRDTYGLPAI
jgi:hypothetical protein